MLIVGERINSTRKAVAQALAAWDTSFLQEEACAQAEAGAHWLDVNCGTMVEEEEEWLPRLVELVQNTTDLELSLDSPNPRALARALPVHRGRALVNSITGQKQRWEALLPLLREWRPRVVVLCLSDEGIPPGADGRIDLACRLVEGLQAEGLEPEDLFVDPLVQPLCTDPESAREVIRVVRGIKERLPRVRTITGVSNVSHGLPARPLLNRSFLCMLQGAGLDAAIVDPLDSALMKTIRAGRALLGEDPYGMDYIKAYRRGCLAEN